ncbi:MAG TPA: hypothetical protein VGE10_11075 [Zeimonas sp.]
MTQTDPRCDECRHQRHLQRYAVATCARAPHPHGGDAQLACRPLAWEACQGRFFEAKR